ncbi:MAG TPA: helix-turn-helix transcriptional regulator [Steroidobacteraceae bacterium]|jgi:transcriptional regulator with XRE-family HTH domain
MQRGARSFGDHLRDWRRRRGLSQLGLAGDAQISARHLSFVETGRARPSRDMVVRLAEQLQVPLRERNVLLVAAGYAPMFPDRPIQDPALAVANEAMQRVLMAHLPFPAFALDRYWNIVASNSALPQLYQNVDASLLKRPVNALQLSLHPRGLSSSIENLEEWRAHLLHRLQREISLNPDPKLIDLRDELTSSGVGGRTAPDQSNSPLALLKIRVGTDLLTFFSTTMVFGTAGDLTLSELVMEFFFPANAETSELAERLQAQLPVA